MPYDLIALFAALITSAWFVIGSDASYVAKTAVTALFLGALAIGFLVPEWWLVELLVQVILVIGISLYAKVQT